MSDAHEWHLASVALILCLAAIPTPLQSEESLVGTAWQCGRDYLQVTFFGLGGAAQEATIWPNKKGPDGDGEELILHQLGWPPEAGPNLYHWKNAKFYYRGRTMRQAQNAKGTEMSDERQTRKAICTKDSCGKD